MTHYARRTDANHAAIRSALRAINVHVHDMSHCGGGLPDLMCFHRGKISLLEVKDGSKPPSARELTVAQQAFHASAAAGSVHIHVVKSVDEALALFGAHCELTGPESFAEGRV